MGTAAERQPAWHINPSAANNRDTGVDAAHPLRDWEELARRLGRGTWHFRQPTTITITGTLPNTDCLYVPSATLAPSSPLTIQGGSATVLASGTISTFTAFNAATQTLDTVTVAWTSGGSSFAPYEKKFMRIPTGARAGTIWAIDRDLGSSTAEISNPGTSSTTAQSVASGFTRTVPVATDPFEIISLPTAHCGTFLFGLATERGSTNESVTFQDISLGWSSTLNTLAFYKHAGIRSDGPRINVRRCELSSMSMASIDNMRFMQNVFLDSRYVNGISAFQANLQSPGSGGGIHLSAQGLCFVNNGEVIDGGIVVALANSHMVLDSLRQFRSPGNGVTVQAVGSVEFGTDVWGTGNTLYGVHVHSLGHAQYTTSPPTINAGLGPGREVRLGDVDFVYADLPLSARDATFALKSV